MQLPDLKELGKVIDLCRKKGVQNIELPGGLRLELGPEPEQKQKTRNQEPEETDPNDPFASFPVGELTPTQLMFYSSGGLPEDDPELKAHE